MGGQLDIRPPPQSKNWGRRVPPIPPRIDAFVHSHGLRQLVDDKSVASGQQTCCKLIVKSCYPHACCKLFRQVARSRQMTSCNKPG